MRKRSIIGGLFAGLIVLEIFVYTVLDVPDPARAVQYRDARVPVSTTVRLSVDEIRNQFKLRFEQDSVFGAGPQPWPNLERFGPAYGPQLHSFSIEDNADGGPEGTFELAASGLPRNAPVDTTDLNPRAIDPGLPEYLSRPPAERQRDLYIQSSFGDWTANDVRQGRPVTYSSSYFLSFQVLGPHQTRMTVYGNDAHITDGMRLSVLSAYGLRTPYWVENRLAVPPSPTDKRALLTTLLTLLDQQESLQP